jgi:periplasmic divalent cation tolerance protein
MRITRIRVRERECGMSTGDTGFQLVLTTAGSEDQALTIARELVNRRLAACVSIVTQLCSVFRWKGEVNEEEEKLLLIKSERRLFPRVRETIRELHSYDVPEILAVPIQDGDPAYLGWLGESLKQD